MAGFEEQLTALETVVERLERGELPLEESVRLFEEGIKLSNACRKELEAAEGRIQVLLEQGDGLPKIAELNVQPFEEGEEEE